MASTYVPTPVPLSTLEVVFKLSLISSAGLAAERDRQLITARRDIHFGAVEARARPCGQRASGRCDRPAIDNLPGAGLKLRHKRRDILLLGRSD